MKPYLEKVSVPADGSWVLFERRLDDEIPFQWHHHPEFELTLTLNSQGQRYVGDNISAYGDGDLVLLGPNLPHTWNSSRKPDPAGPHVAFVMWFRPEWADALTKALVELGPVKRMLAAAGRGLAFSEEAAARVRPAVEALPGLDPAARLIKLLEVLTALSQDEAHYLAGPHLDEAPAVRADGGRMGRVLEHVHAHYHETLAVADLAALARLSPSGFHRLFGRHTRLTLSEYVAQLRVGRACALLVNTGQSVSYIAGTVGYASLANFNRQFRALKQMTPREFRKRFRR